MSADLLSNMLSSIKNAAMAKNSDMEIPYSGECEAAAKVLKDAGYLAEVKSFKPKGKKYKMLRLEVAYDEKGEPKVSEIKRVSKPGNRVYKKNTEIKPVLSGYGIMVVSTSRGVMSGDEARKKKLGGEVLCEVN
jgi:small subunit ribosomal protein S8